ncbi:GNAT family N-acetyltransferase [Methylosinus sp. Ce-a6]|uniref:GNAT family N-acetyltransferase n=1 Tax=Methylosinus sp. Ce-a6 TaxID=2172005 RepID=UPI0013570C85|nr:GNAT family N-acetyltransferase [Methylosinus sp. Ce-a6]
MTEKTPPQKDPDGKSPRETLSVVFHDLARESPAVAAALGGELAARFRPRDEAPYSIIAHDDAGALIGGLNGVFHWRWLYIRHLWVSPERRGIGLGTALLRRAESEARSRDCLGLYIDSFDPRAARLYERFGFVRFGEIADFPLGHSRMFFSKRLEPA